MLEDEPRHSVRVVIVLIIDLFLVACACLQLAFAVPVFGEMFRSFGAQLPRPTETLVHISNAVMAFHGVGFCLLSCFVFWMIIRMYLKLHRRGERTKLETRLRIILLSCFVLMGIMAVIMFLPIFQMGEGIR